jgi:hypothetical protein
MKKLFTTALAAAGLLLAQQGFDFKSLDKLDALASNRTKVTLDANLLGLAAAFLGNDGDKDSQSVRDLVKGLKGIYVRSYQFDKQGQYSPADVEPFRAYLKQQQWSNIVESVEGKDLTEVYVQTLPDGKFGGVAIVDVEPRELTVVYINGIMNMTDLQRLEGSLDLPGVSFRGLGRIGNRNPDGKKNEGKQREEKKNKDKDEDNQR